MREEESLQSLLARPMKNGHFSEERSDERESEIERRSMFEMNWAKKEHISNSNREWIGKEEDTSPSEKEAEEKDGAKKVTQEGVKASETGQQLGSNKSNKRKKAIKEKKCPGQRGYSPANSRGSENGLNGFEKRAQNAHEKCKGIDGNTSAKELFVSGENLGSCDEATQMERKRTKGESILAEGNRGSVNIMGEDLLKEK
ncbi:hypothetical protein QQP08_011495 [Theobroma cacao]|nr:hypothetical protein QQP08_011495 [Theobroma cacao]